MNGLIKNLIVVGSLILAALVWSLADAADTVFVTFGHVDSTPVLVSPGQTLMLDTYIKCTPGAYVSNLLLTLGTRDLYIVDETSPVDGVVEYPFTQWDDHSFIGHWEGAPNNPPGYHGRGFLGFADLGAGPNPWLHFTEYTRCLRWALHVTGNTAYIGDTVDCFIIGQNGSMSNWNAGDTSGGPGYPLVPYFCKLIFIEPPGMPKVSIWYGNPNGAPVAGIIGQEMDIDVYASTTPTLYVADLHLCLGANNNYIDSLLGFSPNIALDSLWMGQQQNFPPNDSGWSSLSFEALTGEAQPLIHSGQAIKIGSFRIKLPNDPGLLYDTVNCLGAGINSTLGQSYANDSIGGSLALFEHFSPIFFHYMQPETCDYVAGDFNNDGVTSGGDVMYGVRFFKSLTELPSFRCYNDSSCTMYYALGDATGNCQIQANDITRLVAYFKGLAVLSYCPWTPPRGR
jgi:hypothetical protein